MRQHVFIRGFTIIELSMVLIISGLGILFTLPNLSQLAIRVELRSCARDIYRMITDIQALAASENMSMLVKDSVVEKTEDWKLIVSSLETTEEGRPSVLVDGKNYPDVQLHFAYLDQRLVIDPVGRNTSSGHILLQQSHAPHAQIKIITSGGAGRVRICYPGGKREHLLPCFKA